ncbi:MAG: hypothetical protein V2B14_01645 [bacterium]
MIDKKKFLTFGISALIALNLTFNSIQTQIFAADEAKNYKKVDPLELVANPQTFLNDKIDITATFDKFSTLGLDYKPAFRDSKKYISFLLKRPDITTKDYTIPLSELKLIISREKAEKLTDLESGDQIDLTGEVFSNALNDPWVDVEEVKILNPKPKTATDKKNKELEE